MDLKVFVKQVLIQINEALTETNAALGKHHVRMHRSDGSLPRVQFDVAVTVQSGRDGSGSGSLMVAGIGVGGEKGTHSSETTISRVQFNITMDS